MKILIHTQKVTEALSSAARLVGKKESLPVLSCFLLEAMSGQLTVRATNLESGVEIKVPAQVLSEGMCAVPAQTFLQALRTMRAAEISLELAEGALALSAAGDHATIRLVPHEEFPSLPIPDGDSFIIPVQVLVRGIKAVSWAASPSTIRPEFASVFVSNRDSRLYFVATDSFRLAEKNTPLKGNMDIPDILIPAKGAVDIIGLFEKLGSEEQVTCTIADNQLHLRAGSISCVSRIVDGSFPAYETIIPKKAATEATLLKEEFGAMLQKARIFSGDTQQVGLHAYPHKKLFSATAQHSAVGSLSEKLDAALTGEDVDINFNVPLLADCLQAINVDSVVLSFGGANKPLIIHGVGDDSFRYVVMPLNR